MNLPPELWLEVARNALSKEDLGPLRCANTTFNKLVTPVLFESIAVKNNHKSAHRFWDLLHTHHIARHVQSIAFIEEKGVAARPVWKRIEAAFALLHRTPALKTLALLFNPTCEDFCEHGCDVRRCYTHQLDIIAAIGSSQCPLPRVQSLAIHGWTADDGDFKSLYYKAPIAELISSLRHLRFSIPGVTFKIAKTRTQFWDQVIVPRVLQPAVNLESLEISNERSEDLEKQLLNFYKVATYPRLAVLTLRNFSWEQGTSSQGDINMHFPVDDFIVRHRKTLKKLELYNCTFLVEESRETPSLSWASVYNQLAEELTELVELVVEFENSGYCGKMVYPSHKDIFRLRSSEWAEQDQLALERFKAVVENRKAGAGTRSDCEGYIPL